MFIYKRQEFLDSFYFFYKKDLTIYSRYVIMFIKQKVFNICLVK